MKKFLVMLAIIFAGNFLATAHAEIKNYVGIDTALLDFGEEGEDFIQTAKNVAKERAIQAAKEKAGVYVETFSRTLNGRLTDDDISAVTNEIMEILSVDYKSYAFNAKDENGKDFGKVGHVYEATVTVKIDTDGISKYINKTAQEKQESIERDKDSQKNFEEINKEFEDLRANAKNKTPEQIKSELEKIDSKISATESKPMIFSQPVKIGEVTMPPMGYFELEGYSYHKGTLCTEKGYEHLKMYEKGIATFGNGEDALYFNYDAKQKVGTEYYNVLSKFGSKDIKNAIQILPGIPTIIRKINTNKGITLYLFSHGNAAGFGIDQTLIGKRKDGIFVKYFDTGEIKKKYFDNVTLREKNISDEWDEIILRENVLVIRYGNYGRYDSFNAMGEFRFKWDEAAQWFGIEQIKY